MATCKDCIHYGVCDRYERFWKFGTGGIIYQYSDCTEVESVCRAFKGNSRWIELPCKIGDKVYRLSRQCGEWKILPRKVLCITYHGGTRWCLYTTKGDILGDNVFLTKADAEAEVARRESENG